MSTPEDVPVAGEACLQIIPLLDNSTSVTYPSTCLTWGPSLSAFTGAESTFGGPESPPSLDEETEFPGSRGHGLGLW